MNKKILAIIDSEESYAFGLTDFLSDKSNLPFRVHLFTSCTYFENFEDKDMIESLLISERSYCPEILEYHIPHIIILSETGNLLERTLHHINKYQPCENIYKEILKYYTENLDYSADILRLNAHKLKIIGIYTPIGRCLQTTFAFALGQLISKSHKALYLNFERYSGLSTMMRREFSSDISDLMYYFECAKEKLTYRIESMVENVNGLDFIPPVNVFGNLVGIKGRQWLELFEEMERCTEYEYLILDLTDGMLDLWDVLRGCDTVFTISRQDPLALAKTEQYKKAIEQADYKDVLNKTTICKFPIFHDIPQKFDELTKSELAIYIKNNILPNISGYEDLVNV